MEHDDLHDCQPDLGNEVNVCGLTKAPNLKWNCDSTKLYTLFYVDLYPLGKANPLLLQYGLLWWVVNIPGCDVDAGKILYEYQQPLPLYGSGINRYAYGIFEQPSYEIDWSEEEYVSAT